MARVIATDLDGELSQNGALTNPLFTRSGNRASVGDVGTCTIKTDTVGWESLGFTLGCTAGLSLSLDGVTYAADGASLALGDIDSTGTLVYVKASSVSAGTVSLLLEQSGLVYTASTDVTVVADLLTLSASTNASTQSGTASIVADTLTATASLPAVTVDVASGVNVTVNADLLTATAALQASNPSGGASITSDLLTATSALQSPTVSIGSSGLAAGTYYLLPNGTMSTSAPSSVDFAPSDHWFGSSQKYMSYRLGTSSAFAPGSGTSGDAHASPLSTDTVIVSQPLTASGGETVVQVSCYNANLAAADTRSWTLPATPVNGQTMTIYFETRGEYDGETDWSNCWLGTNTKLVVA